MTAYFRIYRADQGHAPKVRHATIESAIKEAERLSEQHPGEPFEILKCVAITRCTKASTFWMDGEEPPETPAYRMLEDDEKLQAGDEYLGLTDGCWRKIAPYTIGALAKSFPNDHRRPIP